MHTISAPDRSSILYFSATGNSFAVARQLSNELGIHLQSMSEPAPNTPLGGAGAVVGIVFPSYYGALPRIVKQYLEQISLLQDTYCFAVVTGGGPIAGSSIVALRDLLADQQIALAYGERVIMVGNYVIKYNPPYSEKSARRMAARTKAAVSRIAVNVVSGKKGGVRRIHFKADNLYRDIEHLDDSFIADEGCSRCGLCEKVCPVDNIRLENGRPQWKHHCEHCVACINWCPRKAIQYGKPTIGRRRYHHPDVSVDDLLRNTDCR